MRLSEGSAGILKSLEVTIHIGIDVDSSLLDRRMTAWHDAFEKKLPSKSTGRNRRDQKF